MRDRFGQYARVNGYKPSSLNWLSATLQQKIQITNSFNEQKHWTSSIAASLANRLNSELKCIYWDRDR